MMKRFVDLTLSAAGLLAAAPLLALIAVLVKLDSRGPVFFRQERVGRHGRPFRIVKFRTMVDNADRLGPKLTQKRDPRITRVGGVLRWLKLDELPQLVNVLAGDMSLVGPRPEDPHFVRLYSPEQRQVLAVRPGIVGPSQILGRNEVEEYPDDCPDTERYYVEQILPRKLRTDLKYVRTCGVASDLSLLVAGLGATLLGSLRARFFRLHWTRVALLAGDTVTAVVVYNVAFGLKFDWRYDASALAYLTAVSVLIALVRPWFFLYFGLYHVMLRYLGVRDFLAIAKAVTAGTLSVMALTLLLGFGSHSRLVFLLDWGLLIVALAGSRVILKQWRDARRAARPAAAPRRNALIIGADDTGERLIAAMSRHQEVPYRAVGFLDDDPAKSGISIHGVKVLGRVSDLPVVTAVEAVDMVVILYPNTSPEALQHVVGFCRARGLEYRLLPTLDRILQGDVILPELRDLRLGPVPPGGGERNGHGSRRAGPRPPAEMAGSHLQGAAAVHIAERVKDRPVLVTGGAGYVGSHVVRKLLERGRRVRVLDSFLYGRHGLREVSGHPHLEILEGDIRHLRTLAIATKEVESVIALAALVGDAACELDPEETLATNLESTQLLANACHRAGVHRLVFASSCSVYGANSELMLNEGSWLKPVSLYAKTRIQSEEMLLRHKDRLSVTILRLSTVFGLSPRMRLDLVVNTFCAAGFFEGRIRVFGGQQWRPNLHCQDAAEAFILAASAEDSKVCGEIFNVGSSDLNHTVLQIARAVEAELPPGVTVDVSADSPDKRDYRVSFDKIQHVLGYRTRFTVADGAREIVQAFKDGLVSEPKDERYHNFRYLQTHGFLRAGALADAPLLRASAE